ncbi:phospholipase D family protein [Pseudidiomarina marina]|uniref:phospholipase D family protein n=1 Tax=Pseudidiomarina marina TaxID=502366 RepID=UPI00384B7B69
MNRIRHILVTLTSLLLINLQGCASLPDLAERNASYAVPASDTSNTELGTVIAQHSQDTQTNAGVVLLSEAKAALDARLMLIEHAEQSIDIQYYIWRDDTSGQMMTEALQRAANRGVRIRLLLDDFHANAISALLHQLNAHPNIHVRLVNPFMPRGAIVWGFITDFERANRRMHNKSLTADNQASIVGGRNVGDDYFLRGESDILFSDLDLLVIGEIVSAISNDFDTYWNSNASYPLELLEPNTASSAQAFSQTSFDPAKYQPPHDLEDFFNTHEMTWANAILVSDAPNKVLGIIEEEQRITYKLKEVLGVPEEEVLIISPYFIPTKAGVESLQNIINTGVQMSVLTNAFATNDVAIVHSGYAKWRKRLLKAGIRLFELRPAAITGPSTEDDEDPTFSSSSASSLHAKTFIIDRQRVFVGSFNFDPRSINLNTELGLVVHSDELGSRMAEAFERDTPVQSFEVILSDTGDLIWLERDANGNITKRHTTEPGTTWFNRLAIRFFSLLPIDSFL